MLIESLLGAIAAGGILLWVRSHLRTSVAAARRSAPLSQAYLEDFVRISLFATRDGLEQDQPRTDPEIISSIASALRNHGYTPKPVLAPTLSGLLPSFKRAALLWKKGDSHTADALELAVRIVCIDFEPGHFNPDVVFLAYPLKTAEPVHYRVLDLLALDRQAQQLVQRRVLLRCLVALGDRESAIGAAVMLAVEDVKGKFPKASKTEVARAAAQTAASELRELGFDSDIEGLSSHIEKHMTE
ncbi:hypothetical protein FJV41_31250 [Myxococcus llanfairpwllgwyngyllgogerychwyrndrobwllllantysiliogogogochensis]|uniref:Uncharacterized protein n=2 Tax=Myxococcus llanfairpwllgwyngyllgogerychwyrndrobwllllantysiliogogogochensis TaxID=2590453 RepID=A0A540WSK4_9BACT|nr:hypothetical protein FJV41_31250 [Myxococcus llanfairpwllgwyngyllgogerychwyrndrobwllllantysiliogogogochensis]